MGDFGNWFYGENLKVKTSLRANYVSVGEDDLKVIENRIYLN